MFKRSRVVFDLSVGDACHSMLHERVYGRMCKLTPVHSKQIHTRVIPIRPILDICSSFIAPIVQLPLHIHHVDKCLMSCDRAALRVLGNSVDNQGAMVPERSPDGLSVSLYPIGCTIEVSPFTGEACSELSAFLHSCICVVGLSCIWCYWPTHVAVQANPATLSLSCGSS